MSWVVFDPGIGFLTIFYVYGPSFIENFKKMKDLAIFDPGIGFLMRFFFLLGQFSSKSDVGKLGYEPSFKYI